jgi:uncharacterized protein (TIGR02679 family)
VREFYATRGRIGGNVQVTSELAGPLGGLFGKGIRIGQQVSVTRIDRALQCSGLGCNLQDLLIVRFGSLPTTRAAEADAESTRRAAFWRRVEATIDSLPSPARAVASAWTSADREYLLQAWLQEGAPAEKALGQLLASVPALPGQGQEVPLAIFASQTTGDPHAYDTNRAAGRFLTRLVDFIARDEPLPDLTPAEERLARFLSVGIVAGSMASTVLAYGLIGDAPWLREMRRVGDEAWLPLTTVARYRDYRAHKGVAFAVENQHVFLELRNRSNQLPVDERPTLLCTSGALSVAAHQLIRTLIATGNQVLYSGDFEWKAMDIAARLRARYGTALRLWHMDQEDYQRAIRPNAAKPARAVMNLTAAFPGLVPAMVEQGVAFQEELIELLWADILSFVRPEPQPG